MASTLLLVNDTEVGKRVQKEFPEVSSVTATPVVVTPPLGGALL